MKKVIITGASDGLGKEIARKCLEKNAKVVNISRHECDLAGVTNIICDLSLQEDIEKTIEIIKKEHADFDVLINCAAIVGMEPLGELSYEKVERTMKINTIAPMVLIGGLYDLIVKNEADVINIGSTNSENAGNKNELSYLTSKWAIRGASKNVGMEFKDTKARMIYINLGGMNTKMHYKDYGAVIENPEEWLNPADVAEVILYTVSVPKSIQISDITIARKNRRHV